MNRFVATLYAHAFILALSALAADWPQFLGPSRNGAVEGPKPGLRAEPLWKQNAGHGFAAPVLAAGKLILFERRGDRESISALDRNSGKRLWSYEYETSYVDDFGFDDGPRSAPTVSGNDVYTFGADGMLTCLDLASGAKRWSVDTKARYGWRKGWFGAAGAPLVEGKLLLLNVGGRNGAGIVAVERSTGAPVWQATDDEASYSSGVAATINGERHAFFLTRAGLVDLDPASGRPRFQLPWRSRNDASVNAATPVVSGDLVFISASYRTGAALVRVSGNKYEKLWSNDESMSNHYSTCVLRDGVLYGFHGRQENGQALRAVDLKTGKVDWSVDDFGAGTATLVADQLLLLRENGELVTAEATPKKFNILAKNRLLSGLTRAYPAYSDAVLCARSEREIGCWSLR